MNNNFEDVLEAAIWKEFAKIPMGPNDINIIKNTIKGLSGDYRGISFNIKSATNYFISPVFNINMLKKSYEAGRALEDIAKDIVYSTCKSLVSGFDEESDEKVKVVNKLKSKESILENVRARLISYDKNESYLENKIWFKYLDLAVVFYVSENSEKGKYTITLPKELIKNIGLDIKELTDAAIKNTAKENWQISPMIDVIKNMIPSEILKDTGISINDILENMGESPLEYIVSANDVDGYGATSMLFPYIYDKLCDQMNTTMIYILPSSIHETIVLDAFNHYFDGETNSEIVDGLKSIVSEVNFTEVSAEEQLSDNVYLYRKGAGKIEIVR